MRKRGLCCRHVSVRLSDCPSHAGIVYNRLNLSKNFSNRLVAPSFWFSTLCADTQFQAEPSQRGREIHWMGKIAIFDGNHRLSGKQYEIGPCLLWNVNRKSYALYRTVTFYMT